MLALTLTAELNGCVQMQCKRSDERPQIVNRDMNVYIHDLEKHKLAVI